MLYSNDHYAEHIQHNKDERRHFFRKNISLTLFERVRKGYLKFYCVRGELGTEQNCNILTPTLMAITAFLSHSPGLLIWGPSLSRTFSFQHLLSNCNCSIGGLRAPSAGYWFSLLHLISNWLTSCLHPSYIIVRHPPSCECHKSHSIQPVHGQGYILIFFDWMHMLFTQVHQVFWQLGRVGGQYATISV